jgi:hypothetical protein
MEMATYWVSFATEEKFLGVAVVELPDNEDDHKHSAVEVVKETIARGCNPGYGSVQVQRIPDDDIPDSFKNRLLEDDECKYLIVRPRLH